MEDEKMGLIKNEVSKVIIDTKGILIDFKGRIKLGHDKLPDIKVLSKQLGSVRQELNSINSVIDHICVLYKEFEDYLEEQQKELEANNVILVAGNKEQLILLINENLPDGMGIRRLRDVENTWKIIYSIAERENFVGKTKKSDRIPFYQKGEKAIGEIMLIESHDDLLLKIKMEDEADYHEFRIDNSLKIYPIINHINTRYNYKEDEILDN